MPNKARAPHRLATPLILDPVARRLDPKRGVPTTILGGLRVLSPSTTILDFDAEDIVAKYEDDIYNYNNDSTYNKFTW